MNKVFLALGIVLLALGIVVYYISADTTLLGNRTHNIIPLGGIGVAVFGALIAAGGVMMGRSGGTVSGQFKCATCGAVFGSQGALDQHSKDKHGKQSAS